MRRDGKAAMRDEFLRRRHSIGDAERVAADAAINQALKSLPELEAASLVAAYASDGTEPALEPCVRWIIASGRHCCFPRSRCFGADAEYEMAEVSDLAGDFVEGAFGIMEPKSSALAVPDDLLSRACWIIPGVAFDLTGARLGRGKAVYDRLLRHATGVKIGVFYDVQRAETIPVEDHDQRLDVVVTEKTIIRINDQLKKESAG